MALKETSVPAQTCVLVPLIWTVGVTALAVTETELDCTGFGVALERLLYRLHHTVIFPFTVVEKLSLLPDCRMPLTYQA